MENLPRMESMEGLSGKKILVTGAAGFVGSHLVKKLVLENAKVVGLDFRIDEKSYFVTEKIYKSCKFEIADIRDRAVLRNVFRKHRFDYIVHLAAQTIVTNAYIDPYETFTTNIMGTVNILEEFRRSGTAKRIVVASSDKAYGKSAKTYSESQPLKGDHPYDVSKSSADLISHTYFKTYDLPVVVTRSGNIYGEGDLHFDRLIPGICKAVFTDSTLVIRSDGKYVRDYLYVGDIVDGYLTLLSAGDDINGQAYNFTAKDNLSVLEVVKLAEKTLKKKIKIKIENSVKNEIPFQHLSGKKFKKLGYSKKTSLGKILPDVYLWYANYLGQSIL